MPASDLPSRPSLEQYKKQSKDLLKLCKALDPEALRRIRQHHPRLAHLSDAELDRRKLALADAQLVIAREHGFDSWPKFARHIEELTGKPSPATVWRLAEQAIVAGEVATLERLLREHEDVFRHQPPRSSWSGGLAPDYDAGDARAIIVKTHYFETWDQCAAHLATLQDQDSPVTRFEAAVDAIVGGNVATLEELLRRDPDLIRARSTRTHHSMLLHYVGANGVEGFRQRTPRNAVRVARTLLDAGAEVDATADMYGGGATTLGLVATSIHPKLAGLQDALIDVLLERGARMDDPDAAGKASTLVTSCLANGRGEAAELLASRGARLDLEGAAGVGRLDIVASFFDADGNLKPTVTATQVTRGFAWAAEFGRTAVVEFLLDHGMHVDDLLPHHANTALHWAAHGGHVDTVKALLTRHASVDVKDTSFSATPLGWALDGWSDETDAGRVDRCRQVAALLVAAGSKVEAEWLADGKIRADAAMVEALTAARLAP